MDKDSLKYTAFATPACLFHWVHVPFGRKAARLSHVYITDEKTIQMWKISIHYFDDFCVFSDAVTENLEYVKETSQILCTAVCLIVKPSKIFLAFSTISFLGI